MQERGVVRGTGRRLVRVRSHATSHRCLDHRAVVQPDGIGRRRPVAGAAQHRVHTIDVPVAGVRCDALAPPEGARGKEAISGPWDA